jgi:hypothetical protein
MEFVSSIRCVTVEICVFLNKYHHIKYRISDYIYMSNITLKLEEMNVGKH